MTNTTRSQVTFRMSGVMGLGPLDENEATVGAIVSFHVSPTRIVAYGLLKIGLSKSVS